MLLDGTEDEDIEEIAIKVDKQGEVKVRLEDEDCNGKKVIHCSCLDNKDRELFKQLADIIAKVICKYPGAAKVKIQHLNYCPIVDESKIVINIRGLNILY